MTTKASTAAAPEVDEQADEQAGESGSEGLVEALAEAVVDVRHGATVDARNRPRPDDDAAGTPDQTGDGAIPGTAESVEASVVEAPVVEARRPVRRRRRWWLTGAEATVVGLASMVLAWFTLELRRLPFGLSTTYTGDEFAALAHVKGVDETGWWFTNPRLGAPFQLEHYDFPHGGESIQVAAVRLLAFGSDAPAAILNAYFLATFALVAMAAHVVLRHLRFGTGLSAVIALLYAFLPFHYWHHVGHIYRSGYYAAPFGALVLLWLAGYGGGLFTYQDGQRRIRRRRLAVVAATVVLIGGTDVVAAAFAPAIAGLVGVAAVLRHRSWATLAACLGFGVSVIAVVIALNTPTLIYRQINGANPETVQRQLAEQEAFALKLSRVILPSPQHPIDALADLGEQPRRSRIRSEGGQALGILGVAGLISGLVAAIPLGPTQPPTPSGSSPTGTTPASGPRPTTGGSPGRLRDGRPRASTADRQRLRRTAGILMLLMILVSVPSGLSYLTAVVGFEEIRTWNRIVVYLGFLAFVCVAVGLEQLGRALGRRGVPVAALGLGLIGVGVFALWDQTPGGRVPYEVRIEAWNRDAHFFHQVEESVLVSSMGGLGDPVVDGRTAGGGAPMVFQLPVVDYPEPSAGPLAYDHFRGYLHTDEVAWSHGAMRGRPASVWQRQLEFLPSGVILDGLAAAGFDGLYVDKWGYNDEGARLRSLIPLSVTVEDERQFYYSLAGRADDLAATTTAEQRARLAAEILDPVRPEHGPGFHLGSGAPSGGVFTTDDARFTLTADGANERPVTLGLLIFTGPGGGHEVTLWGPDEEVVASGTSSTADRTLHLEVFLEIPADGLELRLTTDSPEYQAPGDPRQINMEVARLVTVGPAVGDRIAALDETGRIPFR